MVHIPPTSANSSNCFDHLWHIDSSAHVSPFHESGWVRQTPIYHPISWLTSTESWDVLYYLQEVAIPAWLCSDLAWHRWIYVHSLDIPADRRRRREHLVRRCRVRRRCQCQKVAEVSQIVRLCPAASPACYSPFRRNMVPMGNYPHLKCDAVDCLHHRTGSGPHFRVRPRQVSQDAVLTTYIQETRLITWKFL